jgi:hypothetical protein
MIITVEDERRALLARPGTMRRLATSPWFQFPAGLASIVALIAFWNDVFPVGQFIVLIAIIALLLVALILRSRTPTAVDPDALAADRALFGEFLDLLPTRRGAIAFLRNHPFEYSYDRDKLFPLLRYLDEWDDVEHTFHDPEIEAAQRRFRGRLAEFDDLETQHVFSRKDVPNQARVYPDVDMDWEDDDTRFALDAVRALGTKAAETYDAHQELAGTARRRLKL